MWPRKIGLFKRGTGGMGAEPAEKPEPAGRLSHIAVMLKNQHKANKREFIQNYVLAARKSGLAYKPSLVDIAESCYEEIEKRIDK